MKALEGLLVIDVSRVLAGPYCGQLLADLGATVIKVESPAGDENRTWVPITRTGDSSNYASVNRGKRSLTLNLKNARARELLLRLAEQADVLLHNYLPATAGRLGLAYETLRARNPRLVYCSITGYGEEGPLRDKPGYDLMVQAFSGVMSATGVEGGPPIRAGVSFIDMATGLSAFGAVVSALFARERGGQGCRVRASLLETAVAMLGYHAVAWLHLGVLPTRQGSGSWHLVPYQAFMAADGHVLVGAPNDKAWRRLCRVLELEALPDDPRFRDNAARVAHRDALIPQLEDRIGTQPVAHWVERLEAAGVAVSPLHTIDQVLGHPQVRANGMVVETATDAGAPVPLVGMPFTLDAVKHAAPSAPPPLGAHTDAILKEFLACSDAEIAELRRAGAL